MNIRSTIQLFISATVAKSVLDYAETATLFITSRILKTLSNSGWIIILAWCFGIHLLTFDIPFLG